MTTRTEKWATAASAYSKAKKLTYGFETEIADMGAFMQSAYWDLALNLISASEKPIQIGWAEGAHTTVGYFLGQNGYYSTYTQDGREIRTCPVSASDLAKAFRNQHKDISFNDFMYEKLDEIADACPK